MHKLFTAAAIAAFMTAAATTSASAATPLAPAVLVIHVKDFKYNPTPAKIHVGDRVTFVNDDDEAHTITANDKSFDSEGLDTGGTWQHVFANPGTYSYFCELHPYMKATIVVAAAAAASN